MMCAPTNKGLQTLVSRLIDHGWTKNELVVEASKEFVRPEIKDYCLGYRLDQFKKKKIEIKEALKKVGKNKGKHNPMVRAMVREYQHLHQQLTGGICESQRKRNSFAFFLFAVKKTDAGMAFYHAKPLPKVVMQFVGLFAEDLQFPLKPTPNKKFLLSNARLLACTVNTTARMSLIGIKTPTIIIDEAAQCSEAESLIVASRSGVKRLVMVGDPHQLPALVESSAVRKCNYHESMMERVMRHGNTLSLLLETQYRMHPQISQFPRNQYYEGRLLDAQEVLDRSVNQIVEPYLLIDVGGQEERDETSCFNFVEARVVCTEIEKILDVLPHAEIGVVTPYKAQKRCIEKLLATHRDASSIQVNTVDGFQGAELDVVVLSMVRSNDKGLVGFLGNHRRLNVALTRAKSVLRVIGNLPTLRTNKVLGAMVSNAEKRGLICKPNKSGHPKSCNTLTASLTSPKQTSGSQHMEPSHQRALDTTRDQFQGASAASACFPSPMSNRTCNESEMDTQHARPTPFRSDGSGRRPENAAPERALSPGAQILLRLLQNYAKNGKRIVRLSLIGAELKKKFAEFKKGCVRIFANEMIEMGLVQRPGRNGLASIVLKGTPAQIVQTQNRTNDSPAVMPKVSRNRGNSSSKAQACSKTKSAYSARVKHEVPRKDEKHDEESDWQVVKSTSKTRACASRGTLSPKFLAQLKQSFPDLWRFYKRVADSTPDPKYQDFNWDCPAHTAFWLTRLFRGDICITLNQIQGHGCSKQSFGCKFTHKCIVCGGPHGAFMRQPSGAWVCSEYNKVLEQAQRAREEYDMHIENKLQEHIEAGGRM